MSGKNVDDQGNEVVSKEERPLDVMKGESGCPCREMGYSRLCSDSDECAPEEDKSSKT